MSSSSNQLRFITLAVKDYAGIDKTKKANIAYPENFTIDKDKLKNVDPENGIVIVFPEGYGYSQFEADQEQGKTSLAKAITEVCGAEGSPTTINTKDNDRNVKSRLWAKDGKLYEISITRTGVSINEIVTDENAEIQVNARGQEEKREVKGPKAFLQKCVGPAGVSPMWLMQKSGKEQVEWLRSLYTLDQEVIKFEVEIKKKFDTAFSERTKAGQQLSNYKKSLSQNDYYNRMEYWQDYFGKTSFEDVEKEMKKIQESYQTYQSSVTAVEQFSKSIPDKEKLITDTDAEILDLEKKLKAAKEKKKQQEMDLGNVRNRIADGNKWLEDNKSIKEQYDNLSKKVQEATEFKLSKQAFDMMMESKQQMDHYEDEYQRLTSMVDAQRDAKRKFIASFTPQVEGLEVCLPDDEDKREGLFYNKKPLNLLAESELWEMSAALWKELGIKVIIVENINSLGSGAVAKFDEFIKNGGYVFATMMNRSEKALKITFNTKVPE